MKKENVRMTRRPRHRRGALLLVCLVLLVLFLLLGITFVLTASSFRKGTRSALRAKQFEQPLDRVNVLDTVLMELVRGSSNPRSPLASQNLLGDLYGEPVLKGKILIEVDDVNNVTGEDSPDGVDDNVLSGGGQFMHLLVQLDAGFTQRTIQDYYAGQVLTMVTGPAAGQSRRIVKYDPSDATFVVMAFDDLPEINDRLVVNGREFSGTGNGYLPYYPTGMLPREIPDAGVGNPEDRDGARYGQFASRHSLYPNSTYFDPTLGYGIDGECEYLTPTGLGGQNEDYDAADWNNPWLAIVTNRGIKPSFHDAALIQHWLGWASYYTSTADDEDQRVQYDIDNSSFADLYRKFSFRPIRYDHPGFTGSNPDFASDIDHSDFSIDPTTAYEWWRDGPWDVDNDGDGIPDSIWIDIGLPVQTLEDGRVVKPLAAMLVRDMAGRVNINTAGTLALADAPASVGDSRLAGGVGAANFPRGLGYGPAEIDLRWVLTEFDPDGSGTLASFATDADVKEFFEYLLFGKDSYAGRYGTDGVPGVDGNDLPGRLWMTHVWGATDAFIANHYDLLGLGVTGVDHRGNPILSAANNNDGSGFPFMGIPSDTINDPYEQYLGELAMSTTADRPFTYEELERLLRALDVDNGTLDLRLLALGRGMLVRNRDLITTDSWSIPVYSAGVSFNQTHNKSLREQLRIKHDGNRSVPIYPQHITDVFLARAMVEGSDESAVQALIQNRCIAPEMMAGLRFNVNRLFGDGRDNNSAGEPGYDTVDEPAETGLAGEKLYGDSTATAANDSMSRVVDGREGAFTDVPLDLNRDGELEDPDPDDADRKARLASYQGDFAARQDYARQLYCLLMAIADRDGAISAYRGDGIDPVLREYAMDTFARRMAQYAINVVDFRDADAIMTPFQYDPRPFDGDWTANDPQYVVWGCETPVAMLSESLALHNARLVDAKEDASKRLKDETEPPDAMNMNKFRIRYKEDPNSDEQEYDIAGQDGLDADPANDPDDEPEDQTPDQAGIPVDSLFLEIYCPASENRDYYPPELFTGNALDLARMDDGGDGDHPVWRVVISKPHETPQDLPDESVVGILRDPERRDRFVLIPNNTTDNIAAIFPGIDDGNGMSDAIEIEKDREVWFAPGQEASHQRFVNKYDDAPEDPNTKLEPGEYLVIGPREYTIVSQKDTSTNSERQIIRLDPQTRDRNLDGENDSHVHVTEHDGTSDSPSLSQARRAKAIVCQASPPTGWIPDYDRGPTGLNVSAPQGDKFYAREFPVEDAIQNPKGETVTQTNIDDSGLAETIANGYSTLLQFELEGGDTKKVPLAVPFYQAEKIGPEYDMSFEDVPVAKLNHDEKYIGKDTTVPNYRTAFLQRLANPLQPHDPTLNPYISVDWISIDLTIYAGDESMAGKDFGPPDVPPPPSVNLRTRERGVTYLYTEDANGDGTADDPAYSRNLWQQAMLPPQGNSPNGMGNGGFNHDLVQSLGFLNRTFIAAVDPENPSEENVDIQNANSVRWFSTSGQAGDPRTPFSWLVWNDRPFVSQYELMQVPASQPGQLGFEFSDGYTANLNINGGEVGNRQDPATKVKVNNHYTGFQTSSDLSGPSIGFNHLLNFFFSGAGKFKPTAADPRGINLGAIFDYLCVPSLYPNSNTILNPKDFTGPDGDNPWTGAAETNNRFYDDKEGFGPPFNYVSNYREPGKINLNSIHDPRVWWALMHGRKAANHTDVQHPAATGSPGATLDSQRHPGPSWGDFVRHRRGYGAAPDYSDYDPLALQDRASSGEFEAFPYYSPTYIGLPFRSQVNWDLSPMIGIVNGYEEGDSSAPGFPFLAPDVTLLRREVNDPDMTKYFAGTLDQDWDSFKYPLFRDTGPAPSESARPYADDNQNSYFKYQPINRLGNLTTTQSNVYSIWITVGYFEVTNAPLWTDSSPPTLNDYRYPDGYQLGREVGEDTGEITRHRAFYIVDRSIPVAYENGQDYNVENVIKLRRKIE